jgi:hypothetical protein
MNYKESIIKNLKENGKMNTSELLEAYYQERPDLINVRRARYEAEGCPVTEKELYRKVQAEIGATIRQNRKYIMTQKENLNTHSLTPDGIKYYDAHYGMGTESYEESTGQEDEFEAEEEAQPKIGIVYLLKSAEFPGTYKVGQTIDLAKRIKDLKKDNRYGVFAFDAIMYVECDNYLTIERTMHKFLEDYRLAKKNKNKSIEVDTEIFKDCPHIEQEFELFASMLSSNPRFPNTKFVKP